VIVHVVLFRPKASVPQAERRALAESFAEAVRTIPSVKSAQIGRRVRHGAGYEAMPQSDLQYAALITFDDRAGLEAYLRHPAHAEPGRRFFEVMDEGVALDYDVRDGREAGESVSDWLE
jgi:hypothetical protein